MICFRGMAEVTLKDEINIDVVRIRTGMVKKLEDRAESRIRRWFVHMLREDSGRLVGRVMKG